MHMEMYIDTHTQCTIAERIMHHWCAEEKKLHFVHEFELNLALYGDDEPADAFSGQQLGHGGTSRQGKYSGRKIGCLVVVVGHQQLDLTNPEPRGCQD